MGNQPHAYKQRCTNSRHALTENFHQHRVVFQVVITCRCDWSSSSSSSSSQTLKQTRLFISPSGEEWKWPACLTDRRVGIDAASPYDRVHISGKTKMARLDLFQSRIRAWYQLWDGDPVIVSSSDANCSLRLTLYVGEMLRIGCAVKQRDADNVRRSRA